MMKIVAVLVAVAVPSFCYANRSLEETTLASLVALDEAPASLDGVKTTITKFNESALPYLPTAMTLRAEDAVASACIRAVK